MRFHPAGQIGWAVLLMYALGAGDEHTIHHLLRERLGDLLLGCVSAVAGTWAAFGHRPRVIADR